MKEGRRQAVATKPQAFGPSPLSCKYCQYRFREKEDLEQHVVLHFRRLLLARLPPEAPFKCPLCEHAGAEQMSLLLHYGVAHPEVVQQLRASHPPGSLDIDMSFLSRDGGSGSECESSSPTKDPLPPYRAQAEDKKFPKCRACNYRYFTRLDLCRHFVDFHLRAKVSNWIAEEGDQCPSCPLKYPKRQSRLRHFIWSHQDLERLALQEVRVKLSEFMPSTRDLDIVQM